MDLNILKFNLTFTTNLILRDITILFHMKLFNFTNYSKGAWDIDGSPSIAMDAFIDLGIQNLENNKFPINST